jgi:hypothetical protein
MPEDIEPAAPADPTPAPEPTPVASSTPDPAQETDWKTKAEEITREARKWETRAKENSNAAKELEKLRQASMSEQEKAIAEARDQVRAEMVASFASERVKDKVALAAAGRLADPDDATALLGDLSGFILPTGEVDTKAIVSAIDALVKAKPYLAPQTAKAAPLPGGGAKPSNGFSMDDFIRTSARGRN